MANGSAHGVGIYTARLGAEGAASLSKGFCNSDKMFLCGVCDTSSPITAESAAWKPSAYHVMSPSEFPKRARFGNLSISQESEEVLHVGKAMVVFDERCVAPLFVISTGKDLYSGNRPGVGPWEQAQQVARRRLQPWEQAQQVGRRRLAVPEEAQQGIIFADLRAGVAQMGRTVWLPAREVAAGDQDPHCRKVKRRADRLLLRAQHREERRDKFAACFDTIPSSL